MAKPGYGKRSAPDQRPRTRDDFAHLPTRERYVAGFIDHLPEGAAMSVKTLAKQLPLYGQQAVSTSLTDLSVAGHLRRVRCPVGAGDEIRWVFRTFWSRTARDNEWWNTYLATEQATLAALPAPGVTASSTAAPPPPWAPAEDPPPPALPDTPQGEATQESPEPSHADAAQGPAEPAETPAPTSVPHQRTPADPPDTAPAPGPARSPAPATGPTAPTAAPHSPAYLALARLGRTDQRLALSADDCAALEAGAAAWFARGVDADYLTAALTAGLPERVDSPVGFVRRRLADKIPPRLPDERALPDAPAHRVLVECTDCGTPGRPEALPDGLCRPCRAAHRPGAGASPAGTAEAAAGARDIGAYVAVLRDMLRAP
ncbi:MarR family transcriptional regulator [Streptomyces sp. VB1]|uniref:MarR family transcriptional regulator n=1 Tax=Streptomyces sp. VB1 TaxID=2986803 RepID=UPI00224214BD|nr:MarR family transcriptional regulator [Streptomyces sp. VB1]UZI29542.1 MarR family transcriptional regulator [Streptomyces sp. VB1]